MALAEAYAMTQDPALLEPAQKAIDHLLSRQSGGDGTGASGAWDYQMANGRYDASVSGWCIMALKSAKAGGLDVGNGMDKSKRWLERTWKESNAAIGLNPTDPYEDISTFPYKEINGRFKHNRPGVKSRTPIGLCIGVFLGEGSGDIMMETMANEVMKNHLPTYADFNKTNQYYLYYNTLGIFQVGGERWMKFNRVVHDMLVNSQRKSDDCFDGSWDLGASSMAPKPAACFRPPTVRFHCRFITATCQLRNSNVSWFNFQGAHPAVAGWAPFSYTRWCGKSFALPLGLR